MGLDSSDHPEDEVEECARTWEDFRDPKEVLKKANQILIDNGLTP